MVGLSQVWAGPLATRLLGQLGAGVIKVEEFACGPKTLSPGSSVAVYPGGVDPDRHVLMR